MYCLAPLALTLASGAALVIVACNIPPAANLDAPTDVPMATSAVAPPTAGSTPSLIAAITPAVATPSSSAVVRPARAPTGPVTMTLGLDEAESTVLAWFLPENDARVDGSLRVTTKDACAAWGDRPGEIWLSDDAHRVDVCPSTPGADDPFAAYAVSAPAYVIVEASFRGADIRIPGLEEDAELDACLPVAPTKRVGFLAWFDATTGEYLGWQALAGGNAACASAWYRALADRADGGRDRGDDATREPWKMSPASMTATVIYAEAVAPPPVPTLRIPPKGGAVPRPLGIGEVPSALSDIARIVPLVPGAWWRYRVTGVANGVHWWRTTYTETIATGMRLARDLAAVRVRVDVGSDAPAWYHWSREPWGPGGSATVRFLVPEGILLASDRGPIEPMDRWLSLSPRDGGPLYNVRLPLRAGEEYNYWWRSNEVADVSVPAGDFHDCTATSEIVNAGNSFTHWLCPGVGYVLHDDPGCNSWGGGYTVYELEEYFVPATTSVP